MEYKYPNVKSSSEYVRRGAEKIEVHEDVAPFIDALAVKYPHWEFRTNGIKYSGVDNEIVKSYSFKVFNDENPREEVGEVKSSSKYVHGVRHTSYVVFNRRLAHDRERGHCLETTKLHVAMKAVHKYFNPPPVVEILEHVMTRGVGQYNHLVAHKERKMRSAEYGLQASKEQFIKDNWDKYLATLPPITLDIANKYKEEVNDYLRLFNVQKNNYHLAVVIQNNEYVVSCNDKITTYDVNTIPIELKAQIGLLKLMEENDVLEDVGVRTKEGFLVFLPKDKEHEVS
jgi:hypothetical protein